jgi:hypothetical protein
LEAIMSSPIHHPKDLDPALMYAPPWARDKTEPPSSPEPAPPIEWPPRRPRVDDARGFSGDRAVLEVKRQLALDPDMLPEPPSLDGNRPKARMMWRLGVAAVAAALAAWVIVWLPASRLFQHEAVQANVATTPALIAAIRPDSPQAAAPVVAAAPVAAPVVAAAPVAARDEHEDAAASAAITLAAAPSAAQAAAAPPPPPPAPARTMLRLDDREIAALIMRGQNFIANRDLASARLVLQRAADAGSANAALALASTFDPLVIKSLGATGGEPDVALARKWYQKAIELGSTAASQQLAKLVEARQ